MSIRIKFWGVRGSIPCPGPKTVHYGGNTACLELRFGEKNRLVIIDAGSGIRSLGNYLMANDIKKGPIDTDLFLSHTHWDHIMGFPFFTPIFVPGSKIRVYGPVTFEEDGLDKVVGGQLEYRYFPIKHSELAADLQYSNLMECELDLGDGIRVRTKYLNHPILCLGYRFEYEDKVFCTAYDTEPFRNVFPTDPDDINYDEFAAEEGEKAAREENEKVLRFFENADVLVHDSQYTRKEYETSRMGWGHSPMEYVINAANKAGVKKLVLFHHDPERSDDELDSLLTRFRKNIAPKTDMEVDLAREGNEYVL